MEARGEGYIVNMDWLTMFADYRVPQALVYLGVLEYSDSLMEALKNGKGPGKFFHWSLGIYGAFLNCSYCFKFFHRLPVFKTTKFC